MAQRAEGLGCTALSEARLLCERLGLVSMSDHLPQTSP